MPLVKACGVKNEKQVEILDGLVDYIGLVLTNLERLNDIASTITRSKSVLVVEKAPVEEVVKIASRLDNIRIIQYNWFAKPHEARRLAEELKKLGLSLALTLYYGVGGWSPLHPIFYAKIAEMLEYVLVTVPPTYPFEERGLKAPSHAVEQATRYIGRVGVKARPFIEVVPRVWLLDVDAEELSALGREGAEKIISKIKTGFNPP